jgi:uncharacterized protein YqhQ
MGKLRLGGMALANGVLVHGPTSWGAAVRTPDGGIATAAGRKRRLAPGVETPLVRGPLRLAEALAVLPDVRRALPEARFAFERPVVLGSVVVGSAVSSAARRASWPAVSREAVVALASLAPAVLALRGGELAAYHGAEHVSIGTYESDEPAAREHERCGSHLIGPLLVTGAAAGALAQRSPERLRPVARAAAALGALGVSVEIFAWMQRNPGRRLARALARPGYELQHRLATAEPSPDQLDVARAALEACLAEEAKAA